MWAFIFIKNSSKTHISSLASIAIPTIKAHLAKANDLKAYDTVRRLIISYHSAMANFESAEEALEEQTKLRNGESSTSVSESYRPGDPPVTSGSIFTDFNSSDPNISYSISVDLSTERVSISAVHCNGSYFETTNARTGVISRSFKEYNWLYDPVNPNSAEPFIASQYSEIARRCP